jgi:hypothetical protein
MKTEHVLTAVVVYLYLHLLLANGRVPQVLMPLAKKLEIEELTAVVAAI